MDVIQDRELPGIVPRVLRALVVANGSISSAALVKTEIECADYVLAADGGANYLHDHSLVCHAVIGDFDSALAESLPGVERILAADQDHTDIDKAIGHLVGLGYQEIAMIGTTGDRLDHTFGALEMLVKYGRQVKLRLIDNVGCACLVVDESTFRTKAGQTVSLLPIGQTGSVSSDGLKWELKNEPLAVGIRDGLSNIATGETLTVRVDKGDLVIYLHR